MRPTIDLGLVEIEVYTALVGLGALVGLAAAYLFLRSRSRRASEPAVFLDAALVVFAAGWIGARAYHVLTHWDYYVARPDEISQIGLGGFGLRGALVLGLIALLVFARVRHLAPAHWLDAAAIGLAIGQAIGWVGALVQGANYGVVSESAFAQELPDLYGLVEPRFPLQHAEIGLFVLVFLGLLALALQGRRPGVLFFVYLLVVSLGNGILGFERGDETAYVGILRVDQIVDAVFAILAVTGWAALQFRARTTATAHSVATGTELR